MGLFNVCKKNGRTDKEKEGVDVQEGQMARDEEKSDELRGRVNTCIGSKSTTPKLLVAT